ncbi:hypothetical protein FHS18_003644 [Paenibacillus phyllosphaerae]|uniref:Uncharacterized protein n=1 Tax=Paenibacillus phyllosphaerae TaxID=274593 RepID=A0A7W5B0R1_9BACL|nr:hypothetical protein [Paenibacillus phyllosphaerae]MBB3111576.1 hypothetical protein [Paenibacillus phyllosphaerae]
MSITLFLIAAYLTYYTFSYGRNIGSKGNKKAAMAVYLLAGIFLPLTAYLVLGQ